MSGEIGKRRLRRTINVACNGICLYSEFTGRQAAKYLMEAFQEALHGYGLSRGWLTRWRGFEKLAHLRTLMQYGDLPSEHVFELCEHVHLSDKQYQMQA